MSYTGMLALLVAALVLVTVAASSGCTSVSITMRTPGPCEDVAEFTDAEGYDCEKSIEENEIDDCWADYFQNEYSSTDIKEILLNCPSSCGLCGGDTAMMSVELYDYSTKGLLELPTGSTFTGVGPRFDAPPSDAVTQTVCLPTPSCFKIRITAQTKFDYIFRSGYEVRLDSDVAVLVSAEGMSSGLWSNIFCLAECPTTGTAYDVERRTCVDCTKGVVNEGGYCEPCEAGTFRKSGSGDSPAQCSSCPDSLWSLSGATSASECFSVDANMYLSSDKKGRVVAYDPNAESYSIVAEDDEDLQPLWDLVFINPFLFVVTEMSDRFLVYDVDGSLQRIFKVIGATTLSGLVKIPERSEIPERGALLAFLDKDEGLVHVVDLSDIFNDGQLRKSDEVLAKTFSVLDIPTTPKDDEDEFICAGEGPSYVSLGESDDELLVSTSEGCVYRVCVTPTCDASTSNRLLAWDYDMELRDIAVIRSEGVFLVIDDSSETAYRCGLHLVESRIGESCTVFTFMPVLEDPDPFSIVVDPVRELVYIADFNGAEVHVYSYEGKPIIKLGKTIGSLISPNGIALRPGYYAPSSTFDGPETHDKLVAGIPIKMRLSLRDVYNAGVDDGSLIDVKRFSVSALGSGYLSDGTFLENSVALRGSVSAAVTGEGVASLSSEIRINVAGSWNISIMESGVAVPTHFKGSPFYITVVAAETSPYHCEVNSTLANDKLKVVLTSGESWELRVTTYDEFGNPTNSKSDEFVGWFDETNVVFSFKRDDSEGSFVFKEVINKVGNRFLHVKHSNSATEIKGSPFSLLVIMNDKQKQQLEDEKNASLAGTAAGVAIAVLAVAGYVTFKLWKRGKAKVAVMKNEIKSKDSEIQRKESEIENLNESLRKKMHTEEELAVMKLAMETMGKARSDELRGVVVNSKDVKIHNMLGKGGFGVVHLGEYNGAPVAVKQLLAINPENVDRFRFECFLMKNLRHPHVVRLVGVCWDETMLACLLEFISNGSLEDHLKKDRDRLTENKMTWKGKLLRVATQCAAGVQYLHNSRYFDEKQECWKDCIIHRDLKPDNILVTNDPEFMAKLTDFGEARAADLNLTMTTVGTPIYIAPEIMRNDHYDSKVDVYSFGIVLVAMMRAEKDVVTFFFESLRKVMKKKSAQGIGINILNNRMMSGNFRPTLPAQLYPSLKKLIQDCWKNNPEERPTFDEIVTRLSGAITLEVNRMPEPDVTVEGESTHDHDDKTTAGLGSEDLHFPSAIGQSALVAENAELKKSIAELETELGELGLTVDEWAHKHFLEVAQFFVPPPSRDEQDFLGRSLALLQDDPKSPFEPLKGTEKKYPSVKMYSRAGGNGGLLWGKCVGEIDAPLEVAVAWVWDYASLTRRQKHKKENGDLVRRTDATHVSRSQLIYAEYKIAPGINNRNFVTQQSWFRLDRRGESDAYAICFEPAPTTVTDVGFSSNSLRGTTTGLYFLERLAPNKTRMTTIQRATMGGYIPSAAVNSFILPSHLKLAVQMQEALNTNVAAKEEDVVGATGVDVGVGLFDELLTLKKRWDEEEARLKEYSKATFRTERQDDEGKEADQLGSQTTTIRLG